MNKVFNWSDDYDHEKQRKCTICETVYDLKPVYGYDTWDLGHYGCTSSREYISGYNDEGCPYCKEREEKQEEKIIAEQQKKLNLCPVCKKAEISKFVKRYTICCDCIETKKFTKDVNKIYKLVELWNQIMK